MLNNVNITFVFSKPIFNTNETITTKSATICNPTQVFQQNSAFNTLPANLN